MKTEIMENGDSHHLCGKWGQPPFVKFDFWFRKLYNHVSYAQEEGKWGQPPFVKFDFWFRKLYNHVSYAQEI